ncbi:MULTISPECIES: glycine--tRNA ligase subunit beta [Veillonella]|uniref:glycine--tRNA ligase subunit beta n=1 Tax=Veillonella TaxID=29465 RepID=UPI00257FD901|nr:MULTISPECIES: glycine--tRNA ligase subunit beta [Veillonella]MBS5067569.1 glycine--tRNA ligase subunit beta [Veillonella sp.]MDU1160761.1 glycine--tRNA ligase subunit beta [Veillonella parvula]MDU1166398.1 glycine--tRNA ligase subunit beta [Veillonella parvula]MDU1826774.1 glycine--tRNA ligase subunit beta [Veillonella sp.]MDU4007969.1 glycine--tRNA ligase subunit beta [Veillonella sp.]
MAKDLLFEIGAEEIPAGFMPNILGQLKQLAETKLNDAHLPFESIATYGTPRRLALIVKGLADTSAEISERHKGPSASIAYDADGNATKAAIGFARGKGLDVADLVVEDGYIYAETKTAGVPAKDIVTDMLPQLITGLNFPKSMHWGNLDAKFVRPVRWLVALLDEEVIPVEFATVKSGNVTRGHRFLGADEINIKNAASYVDILKENFVMVDQDARRELISKQLHDMAASKNASIVWDDDLLEEINYLVEWPTALCGGFEESYLALPDAAIITPMKDHQRYFPLVGQDGKLLPMFLTVRNGSDHSIEVVQAGNERVLRARLDDAKFFFNEDRKKPLIDRQDGLTKIVFQEGLGNLADKTERLLKLGRVFGEECGLHEDAAVVLERATELAKTDLTTGMVTEFTELQGVMGKEYALLDGESPEVAEAIFEQYLPRFAGDVLPQTEAGKVLSIIDKVDNIVATFSRGLIPTGSQDPYALRRQTIGILNILLGSEWNISLRPIFKASMELLNVATDKQEELLNQVEEFFTLRLKNIFLDREVPHHVIDLLLSNNELSVADAEGLVNALLANRIDENVELVQAYTRMYNLVKDVEYTGVNSDLLKEDAEKALFEAASKASEASLAAWEAGDYAAVVAVPATLVPTINQFFEDVMVMDKDEAIKANRLQLVRLAYNVMAIIGDISALK